MTTWLPAAAFALVTGWFLVRARRSQSRWGAVDGLCHALMSGGMGVMMWIMFR